MPSDTVCGLFSVFQATDPECIFFYFASRVNKTEVVHLWFSPGFYNSRSFVGIYKVNGDYCNHLHIFLDVHGYL